MVEQRTENPSVGGSIPPQGTTIAGVAQSAEQLICNQPVAGSIPVTGSTDNDTILYTGRFQSGQMDQTVNLTSSTSVVRIHLFPPNRHPLSRMPVFMLFFVFTYAGAPFLPFDAKKGADSPTPLKCDRGFAVYARRAAAASSTMSVQSG